MEIKNPTEILNTPPENSGCSMRGCWQFPGCSANNWSWSDNVSMPHRLERSLVGAQEKRNKDGETEKGSLRKMNVTAKEVWRGRKIFVESC